MATTWARRNAIPASSLSLAEQKLIATNQRYYHIATLVGGQHTLKGHTIAMEHKGPETLAPLDPLPHLSLDGKLSVSFIGKAPDWEDAIATPQARKNLLKHFSGILRVDPTILWPWLKLLSRVNPRPPYHGLQLPADEQPVWEELRKLPDKLLHDALLVTDERDIALEQRRRSNVAAEEGEDLGAAIGSFLLTPKAPMPEVNAETILHRMASIHEGGGGDEGEAEEANTEEEEEEAESDEDGGEEDDAEEPAEGNVADAAAEDDDIELPDAPAGPPPLPSPIRVQQSREPINEFRDNDAIALNGFPHLFPLGTPLPAKGTIPPKYVRHLLLQADRRFARATDFLFLLFDQMRRHAAVTSVAMRVKGGAGPVRSFGADEQADSRRGHSRCNAGPGCASCQAPAGDSKGGDSPDWRLDPVVAGAALPGPEQALWPPAVRRRLRLLCHHRPGPTQQQDRLPPVRQEPLWHARDRHPAHPAQQCGAPEQGRQQ